MSVTAKLFFRKAVFIAGILYTILYLLGCCTPYVSPVIWSYFTFFSLLFPFLFAGMLLWLVIVFFFYKKFRWLFLVLLLVGFKNISASFGLNIPKSFIEEKKSTSIRVLSWNVQDFIDSQIYTDTPGNARRDIISFIKKNNADIVCIQDFTQRESPAFRNSIKDVINTCNYPYYFFSCDYSRKDGDIITKYGTGIFSKYPITDSGRHVYFGRKVAESLAYADVKINNDTIRVFNTHLQSMYLKLQWTPELQTDDFLNDDIAFLKETNNQYHQRIKRYDARHTVQAKMIKPILNNCKRPFIFCADLNSVPSSYTYHTIQHGLRDAFTAKGFGIGGTYDGFSPTLRIDVVLMSKQFKPVQYFSPRLHASDHFPIVTDIELH